MKNEEPRKQPETTRRRLIDAALALMTKRGFNATTVDEICTEAGVTKGGFFHHFMNKDDITLEALKAWGEMGRSLYAKAWDKPAEPLEEIHRIFDIMQEVTRKFIPCTCMVGMMSQEMALEHPDYRAACGRELEWWTEMMSTRLQAAQKQLKPTVKFDADKVAWFLISLWQGSLLVSKARNSIEMTRDNIKMARAYVDSLFAVHNKQSK